MVGRGQGRLSGDSKTTNCSVDLAGFCLVNRLYSKDSKRVDNMRRNIDPIWRCEYGWSVCDWVVGNLNGNSPTSSTKYWMIDVDFPWLQENGGLKVSTFLGFLFSAETCVKEKVKRFQQFISEAVCDCRKSTCQTKQPPHIIFKHHFSIHGF